MSGIKKLEDFDLNTQEQLKALGAARMAIIRYRASQPEWPTAQALKEAIDDMAAVLTGDREFFYARPAAGMTGGQRAADR